MKRGSRRQNGCWSIPWLRLARALEEVGEFSEQGLPLGPLLGRGEQAVFHVAEELNLHDVNLVHVDAGDFGPSLVRVRVVVQKLVAEH